MAMAGIAPSYKLCCTVKVTSELCFIATMLMGMDVCELPSDESNECSVTIIAASSQMLGAVVGVAEGTVAAVGIVVGTGVSFWLVRLVDVVLSHI